MPGRRVVVDSVPVNDELDLLELRLEHLSPYVDRFVIAESAQTFTGEPKPLHVTQNLDRFAQYADRMEIVIYAPGRDDSAWDRERLARTTLLQRLQQLEEDSVVLLGDVDEFPSSSQAQALQTVDGPVVVPLDTFYRRANWRLELDTPFLKTKAMPVRDLPGDLHALRLDEELPEVTGERGAHLSFMGFDAAALAAKLLAFSHTEYQFAASAAERVLGVSDDMALDHFGRSRARGGGVLTYVAPPDESELHGWLRSRRPEWFGSRPKAVHVWRAMSAAALDEAMSSHDASKLADLGAWGTVRSPSARRLLVLRARAALGRIRHGRRH
ncbi:hypothetical protein [Nocardioides baculatus]|uniref:Glycosyltransferase family 2 protein n=1 Tax=Nocardioides baculatus TaxID=2801337 RepID=A0ABS1LBR1_9ACTN|nr:hypothetical protein [Nocardioides baculatus]MBL0749130.1 hypothetical protein [Nocardioides baculatus]